MLWRPPLESKRMYFENYDYAVRRGGRKDVSSVAVLTLLTDLENIKIKQKQQEERIRRPD